MSIGIVSGVACPLVFMRPWYHWAYVYAEKCVACSRDIMEPWLCGVKCQEQKCQSEMAEKQSSMTVRHWLQ